MSRPLHISDEGSLRKYRTEIPNTIVRGSRGQSLSLPAKWLYVYLKSVAGDNQECWQSTTTMAESSGLSRMAVSRARHELARHGLIALTPGNRKNRDSMHVRIVDIWAENMQEFSNQCTTEILQCTPQVHQQSIDIIDSSQSGVPHRYSGVPHRYSGVPQEIHKKIPIRRSQEEQENQVLSLSVKETGQSGAKSPKKKKSGEGGYTRGFELFWGTWPPSVRKTKKEYAFRLWRQHRLEPRTEEIRGKVEGWKETEKWRSGFEPMPSSWISKREYNDEVPTAARTRRAGEHEGHRIANYPSGKYCHDCKREVLAREFAV